MPEPQPYIVGRRKEVELFTRLVNGKTDHWILNIFGPGGIGKTVVGQKMSDYGQETTVPLAFIDGINPDLTPDRILYAIKDGLSKTNRLEDAFSDFQRTYQEHLVIQEVLQRSGGLQAMFDVVGNVQDPAGLAKIIGGLGKSLTQSVQETLNNRFRMERYLRGADRLLADRLGEALHEVVEIKQGIAPTLIFDTYEEMGVLDDWVCRVLMPTLPPGIKVVILGRKRLTKMNFDWAEYDKSLNEMELSELPEADAKQYLAHYGLRDEAALDKVYRFTGGYPLLLVLVRHLAREAGGWDRIGALDAEADRDRIASKLLERILREESAQEVRVFLEKGVVARWFTPEIISVILEVSFDEARAIYHKLEKHSFVERHPLGLKFHDKVRELLLVRLEFDKPEYNRVVNRLTDYYAEKAGIKEEVEGSSPSVQVQTGLPPELYQRLRSTLVRCGPLESDRTVAAVFVDERLVGWQDELPEADSDTSRAEALIAFLYYRHNVTEENGLVALLNVLAERLSEGDGCRKTLHELAEAVKAALRTNG